MSINESNAAAEETLYAPKSPSGYGLWFTGDYKDVPVDAATLRHRQEAIESYYAGYTAAYNLMKGKNYACKFEWVESASNQADCQCFTLYVFVTPPPAHNTVYGKSSLAATPVVALGDGDGEIDPPKPPPPPPPYL